jgi:hypothetical protein
MGNNLNIFRIILSAAVIAGFFLPWFDYLGFVSGWDIVMANSGPGNTAERILGYSFLLIPLFALIVLIRSVSKQSCGFLLRALPFLVTAILSVLFAIGEKNENGTAGMNVFFSILGVGYYLTVIASLLLIFAGSRRTVSS